MSKDGYLISKVSCQTLKKSKTLPKPALVGRMVRLVLGLASSLFVYFLFTQGKHDIVGSSLPTNLLVWAGIIVALYAFSDLITVGWSFSRGIRPILTVLVLVGILTIWDFIQMGRPWSSQLGWFVYIWLIYTFGHYGIAYILAGLLATPGCETRSLPYLWARLTGKQATEHMCQGIVNVDKVDAWEVKKKYQR